VLTPVASCCDTPGTGASSTLSSIIDGNVELGGPPVPSSTFFAV